MHIINSFLEYRNNKLLKLTIEGGKLFQIPATRSVKNDVSHSYDLRLKRSCRGCP